MRTALGYVRVSTDEQAQSGLSIEAQTRAIHVTAAQRGWELVDVITDAGVSGRKANRPGLDKAKRRMKRHEADVLIVAKLDRLSRSLLAGARLMEMARTQEWAVVTADNAVDMSTASGQFLTNILLSAAEYESAMNSTRTKDAMAVAKGGGAEFGKRSGYPVELLERIHAMRTTGVSMRGIAERLTADGVPTARGGQWHASSVRSVLRSEAMLAFTADAETEARIRALRAQGGDAVAIANVLNDEGVAPVWGGKWWPSTVRKILDRAPAAA